MNEMLALIAAQDWATLARLGALAWAAVFGTLADFDAVVAEADDSTLHVTVQYLVRRTQEQRIAQFVR